MLLNTETGRRAGFRSWRRSRPFWAGLWTLVAGLEILSIPLAPLTLMIHEGIAGVSGTLMGAFLVVLGLSMWAAPGHRAFAGIATLVLTVSSLVLSNFGGFLVGFLLGVLGGAMALSWVPDGPAPPVGSGPPGLGWPQPGSDGPGDTGGGGPGPGGRPDRGPGGAPGAGRRAERSGRSAAGSRLRALGALPAGGALLAGLQPAVPAPAHAEPVSRSPTTPVDPGDPHGGGRPTLCSLLDALLATAGPTVRVDGRGGPARAAGLHVGVDGPLGIHASVGAALPGQRTGHATAPERAGEGGLLGAVTGLLGLTGTSPERGPQPPPHPVHPPRPAGPPPSAGPHALAPVPPRGGTPRLRHAAREEPGPSALRLGSPALPADHGMDGVMSLLPPEVGPGGAGASSAGSPWCLPSISLGLGPGAARYGAGAAASQPFRVRTPLLVLTGLTYHGITAVPTARGPQRVLAFTAYRVDIAALRQTAPLLAPGCGADPAGFPHFTGLPGIGLPLLDMGLPGIGRVDPGAPPGWAPCQGELRTDGAPDATTTATGEPVVLLTRVLSGNLLGLLPVTFTPDMPPPFPPGLTMPLPLFLTDVTADNQYMSADELIIPGLHQTASGT